MIHSPLSAYFEWTTFEKNDPRTEHIARSVRKQLIDRGYGKTIDGWANALAPSCDEREWNRLQQLVELAWNYESRATLDPCDFVRFVEVTRIESPSSADVRVMTIHQSKGLQFDIVVLPELDGAILSGRDRYIMERTKPTQPISKVMRYFSKDLLTMMPESLQRTFRVHSNRTMNEALCLLYVAMTRAIHALHMLVPQEAPRQTAAKILMNALSDSELEPDTELYSNGDPDWFAAHERVFRGRLRIRKPVIESTAQPLELARSAARHKRNLRYVTPSTHAEETISFARTATRENSQARARGSMFHAWLEEIDWLDEGPPDEQTLRKAAGRFLRPGLDLDQLLAEFRKLLSNENLQNNLLQKEYRTQVAPRLFPELKSSLTDTSLELQVHRERRIVFRTDSDLVNGIVDRLVLYCQDGRVIAGDVIDYKSDTVNSEAEVEVLKQLYGNQLRQYAKAIETIYRLDPSRIVTRLGLLSTGEFV